MYHCKQCAHESKTIIGFTNHMKLHSNAANCPFTCGVPNCTRAFSKFAAFKSHLYRDHKGYKSDKSTTDEPTGTTLSCQIEFCQGIFTNVKELLNHLKGHITEGRKITCPFRACEKTFGVKSTFASHISRTHKKSLAGEIREVVFPHPAQETQFETPSQPVSPPSTSLSEYEGHTDTELDDVVDEDLFLKNLSLFYLRLQAKLVLPASVIQTIIEEVQDIHDAAQLHIFSKLKEKLSVLGVPDTDITNVIEELTKNDILKKGNNILRTDQRRKSVFKNHFNYVAPLPLYLGVSDSGKECFAQYVPIKETITSLFESEAFRKQYEKSHSRLSSPDVLEDVWDGQNMTDNVLLKTETFNL